MDTNSEIVGSMSARDALNRHARRKNLALKIILYIFMTAIAVVLLFPYF